MQLFFKNRKLLSVLVFVLLLLTMSMTPGCRGRKGQRKAYSIQKQAAKNNSKEYEDVLKSHYNKQSDSSKQLMKDMKKENKKIKKSQERSLWDRLFNKKCR